MNEVGSFQHTPWLLTVRSSSWCGLLSEKISQWAVVPHCMFAQILWKYFERKTFFSHHRLEHFDRQRWLNLSNPTVSKISNMLAASLTAWARKQLKNILSMHAISSCLTIICLAWLTRLPHTIRQRATPVQTKKGKHSHEKYKNEKHSLAKHGKTQAIC